MSLNLSVDRRNWNELQRSDFIFAAVVHLIVIVLIALISWWQSVSQPEPLPRIEVQMISGKELAKLQEQAKRQPKTAKKSSPTPKLEPASKKTRPAEEPFDPFAPLQSESDVKAGERSGTPAMADIIGKQLSQQEIDSYIAMMQQAVQQHWKVPAGVESDTPDPLVEMVLNRNGSVASVKIVESSGNGALDQTLISAIYAAAPFQIPSAQFEVFRSNRIRFHPLR